MAHPENPIGGGRQICDFPKPCWGGHVACDIFSIFSIRGGRALGAPLCMSHCPVTVSPPTLIRTLFRFVNPYGILDDPLLSLKLFKLDRRMDGRRAMQYPPSATLLQRGTKKAKSHWYVICIEPVLNLTWLFYVYKTSFFLHFPPKEMQHFVHSHISSVQRAVS